MLRLCASAERESLRLTMSHAAFSRPLYAGWKIEPKHLEVGKRLGEGAFGELAQALMQITTILHSWLPSHLLWNHLSCMPSHLKATMQHQLQWQCFVLFWDNHTWISECDCACACALGHASQAKTACMFAGEVFEGKHHGSSVCIKIIGLNAKCAISQACSAYGKLHTLCHSRLISSYGVCAKVQSALLEQEGLHRVPLTTETRSAQWFYYLCHVWCSRAKACFEWKPSSWGASRA